jgi:hypothetical protein
MPGCFPERNKNMNRQLAFFIGIICVLGGIRYVIDGMPGAGE